MQLETTAKLINATLVIIKDFRNIGFEKAKEEAQEYITSLGSDIQFKDGRSSAVKRLFN